MRKHLLPNVVNTIVIIMTLEIAIVIQVEAALSFLGVGIPPPFSSWGNLLGGVLISGFRPPWWLVVFPGAMITMTILAFNLFGDALRDHLDPKLRGRLQ
jgi:peptide/nickel transport system permease protein